MAQSAAVPVPATGPVRRIAGDVLLVGSALLMALTLYMVYMWVPTEQNLGVSQRIFYFHVPLGWIGMVSIMVVAVASILHLFTGKQKWDDLAYSTAEIGIIFASLILITGAIWGKPVWGVWWTWDAKLTTTLVLWFIYVGYLMVRAYGPAGTQGKRFASVIALIGAIDAPIIYKGHRLVALCAPREKRSFRPRRADAADAARFSVGIHWFVRVPSHGKILA